MNGLDEKTVGTLKLVDDGLGQVGEANLGVLIVDVLGQLGNALGIGFSLKLETLAAEESLQLLVVGDDAIVDDSEFPIGVRSAFRGWRSVHNVRESA